MNVNRLINVKQGDALGTLRHFLSGLWRENGIETMLLPVEQPDGFGLAAQRVMHPEGLAMVNPFAPVMTGNAAAEVKSFLQPGHGRVAALMRPCELRALVELEKRHRVAWQPLSDGQAEDWFLTIGFDCPGTLVESEYARQISLQGTYELTNHALAFGQKEGLKSSQLRTACQICNPTPPHGADLILGTIGTGTPDYFLIIARDEKIDRALHLDQLSDRLASEAEVVQRESVAGKMIDEHKLHCDSICAASDGKFGELCSLLACFSRCTLCADCLDACPLYDGELAGMLGLKGVQKYEKPILSELVNLGRWLASCSGCGMCQEACEQHVPLVQLVTAMSHRIQQELHYIPGEPAQALPWLSSNRTIPRGSYKEGMHVISG